MLREYDKLFITALKKFDIELIKLNGRGYSTFNKQIEILLNQDIADIVYLAEDDYIFLPNSLQDAVKFMRSDNSVTF